MDWPQGRWDSVDNGDIFVDILGHTSGDALGTRAQARKKSRVRRPGFSVLYALNASSFPSARLVKPILGSVPDIADEGRNFLLQAIGLFSKLIGRS